MPRVRPSPTKEEELELQYRTPKPILVPTPERMLEIRLVSNQEATRLSLLGPETWLAGA